MTEEILTHESSTATCLSCGTPDSVDAGDPEEDGLAYCVRCGEPWIDEQEITQEIAWETLERHPGAERKLRRGEQDLT